MIRFNEDEINLICLYDPGNRAGTIYELRDMIRYLMPDEAELKTLAADVIAKLERMTDAEYDDMCNELIPPNSSEPDDGDSLMNWRHYYLGMILNQTQNRNSPEGCCIARSQQRRHIQGKIDQIVFHFQVSGMKHISCVQLF